MAKILVASGNDLDSSDGGLIQGSSNRAFSSYSPTNVFLSDSVFQGQTLGPVLASTKNYGLMMGIPRPGTFNDPYISENIIAPNAGIEITPHERVSLQLNWWYLAAFERGIGSLTNEDGEVIWEKLSRDLGHELDLNLNVRLSQYLRIEIFLGYFIPGNYYTEKRDDEGTSFSPLIRGGGEVDNVFLGEFRLVITV